MSHLQGALLRGLMFPGPFQFFHPGTQRETSVHEYKTDDIGFYEHAHPDQHRPNSIALFGQNQPEQHPVGPDPRELLPAMKGSVGQD